MGVVDIGDVTRALVDLISHEVAAFSEWNGATPAPVVPLPPDEVSSEALSFYLYHIEQDPHFRNPVEPSPAPVPVRLTPVGLKLHYLLTAHGADASADATYREQLMMGLAVRALHDNARVDDATRAGATNLAIFQKHSIDQADNLFRLELQQLPPEKAIGYWTAGSKSIRLAAYYLVSVVFLKPAVPATRAGRVLTYNTEAFVGFGPRLHGSESRLRFQVPTEPGPREVRVAPAQTPIGGVATFLGVGLSGDRVELRISRPGWDEPRSLHTTSWSRSDAGERLDVVIEPVAEGRTVVPGTYSAQVVVTETRTQPDGDQRQFSHASNRLPFVVSPSVDHVQPPPLGSPPGTPWVVTGLRYQHADDIPAEAVQLVLGEDLLQATTTPPVAPGSYRVVDEARIELVPPASLTAGFHPLRLVINGAESPPRWIGIP